MGEAAIIFGDVLLANEEAGRERMKDEQRWSRHKKMKKREEKGKIKSGRQSCVDI
jgi:hypothetical protein